MLVLEAMKMQNSLASGKQGKVGDNNLDNNFMNYKRTT